MNRRQFLETTSLSLGSLSLGGRPVWASAPASEERKLVTVFVPGGWDPTRVFISDMGLVAVADFELDSAVSTAGGISFMDHPERPSVAQFFNTHHAQMLVCNGMVVPSIAHDICTSLTLTGGTGGDLPDWPTLIAQASANAYPIPHLVLGGPSFVGDLGGIVARTGTSGQLSGLLSGDILSGSDVPASRFSTRAVNAMDRHLKRRAGARLDQAVSGVDASLAGAFEEAIIRAQMLKEHHRVEGLASMDGFESQVEGALSALASGLSRCVTLGHPGMWDTHTDNEGKQSPLWEDLFAGLASLMAGLEDTLGAGGRPLAQETVVLVLSEMGRAPQLNSVFGKDHWPYTSAMLLGPGITGDRVVGALDGGFMGLPIRFADAEVDPGGELFTAEALGATLLALMDLDPAEHLEHGDPIDGLLT